MIEVMQERPKSLSSNFAIPCFRSNWIKMTIWKALMSHKYFKSNFFSYYIRQRSIKNMREKGIRFFQEKKKEEVKTT